MDNSSRLFGERNLNSLANNNTQRIATLASNGSQRSLHQAKAFHSTSGHSKPLHTSHHSLGGQKFSKPQTFSSLVPTPSNATKPSFDAFAARGKKKTEKENGAGGPMTNNFVGQQTQNLHWPF
jgi:hypothetical protein